MQTDQGSGSSGGVPAPEHAAGVGAGRATPADDAPTSPSPDVYMIARMMCRVVELLTRAQFHEGAGGFVQAELHELREQCQALRP